MRRRSGPRPFVVTIKNQHIASGGLTGTRVSTILAKAVTSPSPTVSNDVMHGCRIRWLWLSIDMCGLGGTGVLNITRAYLMKNPGANLATPEPESVGTSNEKKFVIKQWSAMAMRNQDGNPPYHWEGFIKLPFRYQRMGTDDIWQLVMDCTTALTGHFSLEAIYKWER